MPSLFYAPAYAAVLMASHTYHFNQIDFEDPKFIGRLIFTGRLVVLTVALLAIVMLTWTLARNLDEPRVGVVVLACLSTSLITMEPWTDTKPDGLMNALMTVSLACYATIVLRGLTLIRAMATALFYVASLSSKELTATSMFLPFAGLAVGALIDLRRDPEEGKRKLRILIATCLGVLAFYSVMNVVYAPHTWIERMHIVFGPLKDPAIWASPKQTPLTYYRDAAYSAGQALGLGGLSVLAFALVGTLFRPTARLFFLWLPFLSHLVFTTIAAGYMPPYFMIPLAPMLCLPASEVAARWLKPLHAKAREEALATALIAALCLYLGFDAMALFRETHRETLVERAFYEAVPKGARVNVLGLYRTTDRHSIPGPNGTDIDPNPASALQDEPEGELPDFILEDKGLELWIAEIPLKPAYAALLQDQARYDYRKFPGVEKLGYRLLSTVAPKYSKGMIVRLVLGQEHYTWNAVDVFQRH